MNYTKQQDEKNLTNELSNGGMSIRHHLLHLNAQLLHFYKALLECLRLHTHAHMSHWCLSFKMTCTMFWKMYVKY